jgi:hypothetical protein
MIQFEIASPLVERLVGHDDATLEQHFLNEPQAP